jgi:hypothetical protein
MTLQELETQLLTLNPTDRLRIIQSVIQSLIPNPTSEPTQSADSQDLTSDTAFATLSDRSPHHPLRNIPITIPPDFDEPMTDLWDALEPGITIEPLNPLDAIASTQLPDDFHKDPADRIIVAIARRYDIKLVTCDQKILSYPHVKTTW